MGDAKEKKFLTVQEASLYTGIGIQTIRKMADSKKISCFKTDTGHRRINRESLQRLCNLDIPVETSGENQKPETSRQNYLYTRVSSRKQVDDLSRQVEYVQRPEYANYMLIQDIGSGINFKRKGLQTILDACIQNTIGEVVVAHKDRLSRFGFDLIESIIIKGGGKITLLDVPENKSSEQELADDLLSIVHIFSCRQMGKRSYKRNQEVPIQDSADTVEVEQVPEGEIS